MEKENPSGNPQPAPAPIVMRTDKSLNNFTRLVYGGASLVCLADTCLWVYKVSYPAIRDLPEDSWASMYLINGVTIPPICCAALTYLTGKKAFEHEKES